MLLPVAELASGRICAARTIVVKHSFSDGETLRAAIAERLADGSFDHILADMLRTLCADIAERMKSGLPVVSIVLDLSFMPFPDAELTNELVRIIDDAGVPHSHIIFEFNEIFLKCDCRRELKTVSELRSLGFRSAAVSDSFVSEGRDSDYVRIEHAGSLGVFAETLESARLRHTRLSAGDADSRDICLRLCKEEGFVFASGAYYGGSMTFADFYRHYEQPRERVPEKEKVRSHAASQHTLLIFLSAFLLLIVLAQIFTFFIFI